LTLELLPPRQRLAADDLVALDLSKECHIFCDCPFNPFRLHIAMIVVAPGECASFPDDRCSNAIGRPGSVNKLSGFVEETIV